jgi:hypothetical protein
MTTACSTFVDPHAAVLPIDLVLLIQQEFASQFAQLYSSANCNAVELYVHIVREMSDHWSKIHSAVTCPLCLRRTPEFLLGCGHRICKVCVQVHGQSTEADPYTFQMPTCLLCGKATNMGDGIGLKPETARSRILSCDGGGNRAVISLPALILLERRMNVPEIIPHAFDMMIGSSSGSYYHPRLTVDH